MAEPNSVDRDAIKFQPLPPPSGLLEQFNLPPKAIRLIRKHQRTIWLVLAAAVGLTLASSGYTTYREYREGKAATALDAALIAKQDNRQMLDKIVQEFSSTSSGLWARIELAFLDEREGKRTEAINRLTEINAGLGASAPVKPLLLSKLAGLQENEQQFDKAIALYTELVALDASFAPSAYRALGRLNEQLGKKEEAAAMYGKYLELAGAQPVQGKADPMRDLVQSRLNQLKK